MNGADCFRLIKPVDIAPVLAIMDRLPFFTANAGGNPADPKAMPCDVVLSDKFPAELKTLIAGLDLGGDLARAVIRRLAPFQGIPPHVDDWMPQETDWRRFQLPLVTHPGIKMRWPDDGVEVHLAAGNLYEVRFDRMHEVVNPTDCARTHLQIDQINATI
jgi:hypothetical protein